MGFEGGVEKSGIGVGYGGGDGHGESGVHLLLRRLDLLMVWRTERGVPAEERERAGWRWR